MQLMLNCKEGKDDVRTGSMTRIRKGKDAWGENDGLFPAMVRVCMNNGLADLITYCELNVIIYHRANAPETGCQLFRKGDRKRGEEVICDPTRRYVIGRVASGARQL